MKKQILLVLFAAAGMLVLTACGDYTGKEKTHPLFVKAASCKNNGDYKESVRYFEEFMLVCPRSSVVHYELASLYGDHLGDPLSAIYHYRCYLFLSGGKTQDAADIQNIITALEKKLFTDLSQSHQLPETLKAVEDLKKARETAKKWSDYAKQLLALYNELRAQNEDMRKQISSGKIVRIKPRAKTEPGKPETVKPEPGNTLKETKTEDKPETQKKEETPAPKQAKYIVKKGDTLSKISREVYGNSRYYRLIIKANQDRMPANGRLQIGMELVIPQIPAKEK